MVNAVKEENGLLKAVFERIPCRVNGSDPERDESMELQKIRERWTRNAVVRDEDSVVLW